MSDTGKTDGSTSREGFYIHATTRVCVAELGMVSRVLDLSLDRFCKFHYLASRRELL